MPYLGPILSALIVSGALGAMTYPFAEVEHRLKSMPLSKEAANQDFINQIEFWISDHVSGFSSLPSLARLSEQDLRLLISAVQDAQMKEAMRD